MSIKITNCFHSSYYYRYSSSSYSCEKVCTQIRVTQSWHLDNVVCLKRANYSHPLARFVIKQSTNTYTEQTISTPAWPLEFFLISWVWVFCITPITSCWRNGISELLRSLCLINWVSRWTQSKDKWKNWDKLKFIQMWSSKWAATLLRSYNY